MATDSTIRVLHVDDDSANRLSLGWVLRREGMTVREAGTGAEALQLVAERPDVVLLDVRLPDMSGHDVSRRLRSDPATALIPIIQLSGHHITTADRVQGLEVGADAYLTKPVEPRELIAQIRALVRVYRAEKELKTRLRQQAALVELGQVALSQTDLPALFQEICVRLSQVLEVEFTQLLELLPGSNELLVRAGHGWQPGIVGQARVAAELQSQAEVTLQTKEAAAVTDLPATRFQAPRHLVDHGVVSGISAIIRGHDRPFGVLDAHTARPRHFTQADRDFLQAVANLLAAALQRRGVEEQLQSSETNLRLAVEAAALGIFDWDLTSNRIAWSRNHEALFGVETHTFGDTYDAFEARLHPDDLAGLRQALANCLATRESCTHDFRVVWPDGSVHWLALRGGFFYDEQGQPVRMRGIVLDITARRRGEEAARQLAAIVEAAEEAIISAGLDARITTWNAGAQRVFGYTADEAIGQPLFMLAPPERLDEAMGVFERVKEGKLMQLETVRQHKTGKPVDVLLTASPIRHALGHVIGLAIILRDVSQRKTLEQQLRQAQKMEAVGHLAGGIAHDFNNLLTVITGYSELLLTQLPRANPAHQFVLEMRKASDRAATLTRQLLAFSRRQMLQPVPLDLNAVVSDMTKMIERLIGEDIDLVTYLDPDLGAIHGDPGQIEQVLLNLIVNARDAMPQGGRLTIETKNIEFDESIASSHVEVRPGRYALLAISDSGHGIAPEIKARIFEPFFTTKEIGKGTGLGLAMVHGIVKQSGGHIEVYSEVGRGTTFKVYLPRVDNKAQPVRFSPVEELAPAGNETVLVAEDEPDLRNLARMILETKGYTVLPARDGQEALRLAQDHPGPIHLLLTDVVMPQMSGRQLVEQLATLRPDLRVLYVSGYTDEAIIRHGNLQNGSAFLQKPFAPAVLLRKVREVLDAQRPKRE